jgi:asparagine synthase (glutamine-hydrolysing)
VEYVWRLTPALKYAGAGENKRLLRQVLYRHVPRALVDRPKRGFAVPVKVWLRGPLRPWAEELLDEQRLAEDGFFNPTLVRARWREHLAGSHNRQRLLWCVLMFQQWRRHQAAESAIPCERTA